MSHICTECTFFERLLQAVTCNAEKQTVPNGRSLCNYFAYASRAVNIVGVVYYVDNNRVVNVMGVVYYVDNNRVVNVMGVVHYVDNNRVVNVVGVVYLYVYLVGVLFHLFLQVIVI